MEVGCGGCCGGRAADEAVEVRGEPCDEPARPAVLEGVPGVGRPGTSRPGIGVTDRPGVLPNAGLVGRADIDATSTGLEVEAAPPGFP